MSIAQFMWDLTDVLTAGPSDELLMATVKRLDEWLARQPAPTHRKTWESSGIPSRNVIDLDSLRNAIALEVLRHTDETIPVIAARLRHFLTTDLHLIGGARAINQTVYEGGTPTFYYP